MSTVIAGGQVTSAAGRGSPRWTRAFAYWRTAYGRLWRGSLTGMVAAPVFFLAAMGVGLGSVVDRGGGAARSSLGGVPYLTYIGPGLLAATVMQAAVAEASFPVLGSIMWQKQYVAMLATPLRVVDVLRGHLLWIVARTALVAAVNLAILACFGVVTAAHAGTALLALPAATLVGAAFAAPMAAFAARQTDDMALSPVLRLVIVPLFLFSGAFFPISQLPAALQWVARCTPLWHGTELCRSAILGTGSAGSSLVHVAYLAALALASYLWAGRVYARRLVR